MQSLFVRGGRPLHIHNVPIPVPGPKEVLIRVLFCASNPEDWRAAPKNDKGMNNGLEMSGIVADVGYGVWEVRLHQRVAAAHPIRTPDGAYAEYALAPVETCFTVPDKVSLEDACTVPFSLYTAALGLYRRLDIPAPFPEHAETRSPFETTIHPPIIIYGASWPVGTFALKLAALGNFTKIIAVCKGNVGYVESLNIATHIINYDNETEENIVDALMTALDGEKCYHAFDAMNDGASWKHLTTVLEQDGSGISMYDERGPYSPFNNGFNVGVTFLSSENGIWQPWLEEDSVADKEFLSRLSRTMTEWLADETITGHPNHVMPYGLHSVDNGLTLLMEGSITYQKLLYRISDTFHDVPAHKPLHEPEQIGGF